MARNGSGTYSNPYPNFVSGTVISSSEVDANNSDVATALTQSIAVDGQSTVTASLPMNANKFTGLAVGAAATDSLSLGQAQAEAMIWCGTAGGSANAITLAPSPAITAYAAGQRFVWMASSNVNTGATTVAISGLGAIALQDNGAALVAGNHQPNKMFLGILNTTSTVQIMQVQSSGTDPLIISSLTVSGTSLLTGVTTHGDDVVSDTDSTDDLGTTSVRWANLFVDGITATDQITATGFTGTLDGILGSGAAAAASVTTLTTSGIASIDDTTDTTSGTTGSIHTDGGVGVAKALYVGTTSKLIGVTTHGGNVVSDTDSTDDLGTTGVRWANLFVDAITATDQITATGFTGTLDGILGSGAAAAATVTTLVTSGIVSVDDTTTSTSGTTGSIHTDGGLGVAGTAFVAGAATVGGASQFNSTVTVGVDNTGYDVKLFGATAGKYALWDESADSWIISGTQSTVTAGTSNYIAGVNAGNSIASGGNFNVCVGDEAGTAIETGDSNVAIGYAALNATVGTNYNIAIGTDALGAIVTSDSNVAIGHAALLTNTSGSRNNAVGHAALLLNTTGNYNTAMGYFSLGANVGADNNTALGDTSLYLNTTGASNTAVGSNSLYTNLSGAANTAVGVNSSFAQTTAGSNTAVGFNTLYHNVTGANNTAVGSNALTGVSGQSASYNTAVGSSAMISTTTGHSNVGIGYTAARDVSTGVNNTCVGTYAGIQMTVGSSNVALGANTLYAICTGSSNTAVGTNAMYVNTTGYSNTAVGVQALDANTEGAQNTAVGVNALGANATGVNNAAVGGHALDACVSGSYNTAMGNDALTATTASNNTAFGAFSGNSITTGSSNICIGYDADTSAGDSTNQIVIGYGLNGSENDQFTFGKTSNIVQNEFDTDAAWTRTSDVRKKRNIKDDELGLEFINNLRTVTHQWKPSNEFPKEWTEYSETNNMNLDAVMHGLIAQEVKEALDKADCDTFSGWKEREDGSQTVSREMFVTPLIKAVQELSAEINELKKWKEEHTCG